MYSSYLIYVLFIVFIYLFALCYICFCLFILLILFLLLLRLLLFFVFLNSFYCSCSGFSMYFTCFPFVGTLLFMLPLCIGAFLSVCHRSLYLLLFLFSLLTHCIPKSYCHRYLYDLALVLLAWLLNLLVYNFPYDDFIVN